MRFMHMGVLAAGLALAAPAALNAQQAQTPQSQSARRGARMGRMTNPIARILEQKDQLALTADQTSKLEAISQQLDQQNKPILDKFAAARDDARTQRGSGPLTDAQRQQMRQQREQMRPLFQELRKNDQKAMDEANKVLTPEQQQKVKDAMRAERRHRRGQGQHRGQGHEGYGHGDHSGIA